MNDAPRSAAGRGAGDVGCCAIGSTDASTSLTESATAVLLTDLMNCRRVVDNEGSHPKSCMIEFPTIFEGNRGGRKLNAPPGPSGCMAGNTLYVHLRMRYLGFICAVVAAVSALHPSAVAQEPSPTKSARTSIEISRPVRPWEFLSAVGRRAALLGNESGTVEAWIYPLKLFRDLELVFHVNGRSLPAASLARTIVTRPEAVTLIYASDDFTARETFFVPRDEPGAIISLEISSFQPVEIEFKFRRDFQLMWPAALGGTYVNWNSELKIVSFGEEQKKWFGVLGSPSATSAELEFENNYSAREFSSIQLGTISPPGGSRVLAMSASPSSLADSEKTYSRLIAAYSNLRSAAAHEYDEYLHRTTSLELPDRELQAAYDWARVSVLQGIVTNPFLGTGLIAGYRTSGSGQRPGFAWFFGRDSEWTALALNSEGDFATTRTALDFLMKYQRDDGKVEHEISQSATLIPWFHNFPYAYASADATPLLLIATADYLRSSGDADFVRKHWDNLSRAYKFLRSTWDAAGIAQNAAVGHGWVEGGPLLPVKSEFYQSGLSVEAVRAFADLARSIGQIDVASENERLFSQHKAQINQAFWSSEKKFFAYAVDENDRRMDTASVLTAVPMWFGLTDADKSNATIDQLADSGHSTDWGMRIISARDPRFDPTGYHFGSVWPLFTGWAAVAEYKYHRALPAYANLRANSLLALSGSAGHVTEVLSGAYFEPLSTSSPHQIWSSAMVISSFLRGMLGIETDAPHNRIAITPHVPGNWTWWKATAVRIGSSTYDLSYTATATEISLSVTPQQASNLTLEFSPAISPHAKVIGVEVNGAKWPYSVQTNATDQHVLLRLPIDKAAIVRVRTRDNFSVVVPSGLPELGGTSRNIKVVTETWDANHNNVVYDMECVPARTYVLPVSGGARIVSIDGATLIRDADRPAIRVQAAPSDKAYEHVRVALRLSSVE